MNSDVLQVVTAANAKLVAVTKYLDPEQTKEKIRSLQNFQCFWGIGENRIESLEQKKIDRALVHFIGNIQSRNIDSILSLSSYIHSLWKESHFKKFDLGIKKQPAQFFLQINISEESTKAGILVKDIPKVFVSLENFPDLKKSLIGISALGTKNATPQQTEKEIEQLKGIRDHYIPQGFISYGTSQDYESALAFGASVVRIGQALWEEPVKKL